MTIIDPQGKETRLFPQTGMGRCSEFPSRDFQLYQSVWANLMAVNTPLEESDMSAIEADEVREKFPGSLFAFVGWSVNDHSVPHKSNRCRWQGWFLICLVCLMLVEGVFANRLR